MDSRLGAEYFDCTGENHRLDVHMLGQSVGAYTDATHGFSRYIKGYPSGLDIRSF